MNLTDFQIAASAFAAFCAFVIFQIVLFRYINHRDIVKWFIFLLLSVGIVLILAAGPIAFILYILAGCEYFMGIFGLLATSVRIRLLSEIAAAGERGITWKELLRNYNRRIIIKKRLERFIASGDIVLRDGKYYAKNGLTFFRLPTMLLKLMKLLYYEKV